MAKRELQPIKIEISSILLLIGMACFLLYQAITGLQFEEWPLSVTVGLIAWEVLFLVMLFMNPGKAFSKIWSFVVAAFSAVAAAFGVLTLVTLVADPANLDVATALETAIAEMDVEPTLGDKIDIILGFLAPLTLAIESILASALMAVTLFLTGVLCGGAAKRKAPSQRNMPLIFGFITFAVVALLDIVAYRADILILPYPTTFLVLSKWAFYILFALGMNQIVTGSYEAIED